MGPSSIRGFVEAVEPVERTLTVQAPDPGEKVLRPLQNLLEETFADPHVEIQRAADPGTVPEAVVTVGDVADVELARSALWDVGEALLLVNADLYTTGTRPLDAVETPDVVLALAGTTFTVRGKQKFLLIHLSRHIEALAAETEGGRLHACFQELSRLEDEKGTRRVYETLASSGVDLHVYGIDDRSAPLDDRFSVHTGPSGELARSWFVVHDGGGDDTRKAALVARQNDAGAYDGYWTFEPDAVDEILAYLETTYLGATD